MPALRVALTALLIPLLLLHTGCTLSGYIIGSHRDRDNATYEPIPLDELAEVKRSREEVVVTTLDNTVYEGYITRLHGDSALTIAPDRFDTWTVPIDSVASLQRMVLGDAGQKGLLIGLGIDLLIVAGLSVFTIVLLNRLVEDDFRDEG